MSSSPAGVWSCEKTSLKSRILRRIFFDVTHNCNASLTKDTKNDPPGRIAAMAFAAAV